VSSVYFKYHHSLSNYIPSNGVYFIMVDIFPLSELFSSPLTALTNNDMEKAQLLHSQVTLQVIDVERYHTELVLFTVSGPENNSHLISVVSYLCLNICFK